MHQPKTGVANRGCPKAHTQGQAIRARLLTALTIYASKGETLPEWEVLAKLAGLKRVARLYAHLNRMDRENTITLIRRGGFVWVYTSIHAKTKPRGYMHQTKGKSYGGTTS